MQVQGNHEEQELEEIKVEPQVLKPLRRRRVFPQPVLSIKEYVQYAFIRNKACPIDKASRYCFPCCYLIFNVGYWAYYEMHKFGRNVEIMSG